MNFKGKTVIITGGTSGIGLSLVKDFYLAGAKIILTGTKESSFDNLDFKYTKNKIEKYQLDFSSKGSLNDFIKSLYQLMIGIGSMK